MLSLNQQNINVKNDELVADLKDNYKKKKKFKITSLIDNHKKYYNEQNKNQLLLSEILMKKKS